MNDLMQREREEAERQEFCGLIAGLCFVAIAIIIAGAVCCKYAGLIDAAGKAAGQ